MAYKLLDQNGNKMIINGMNKGYIKVPYNYQGLEWYNVNRTPTSIYSPFYSSIRCIYINGSRYTPYNGTTHKFISEAYSATQITINGRYNNSSYSNYEIYVDGTLVTSGAYTDTNTDIYVINKEANTSVILSGEWDSANSKYIYNIITNAIIPREGNYGWFNPLHTATISLTVGSGQDITTTQYYNRIVLPSLSTISSEVEYKTGISSEFINVTKVEFDESQLYWYNPNTSTSLYNAKATTSSSTTGGTGVLYSNYRNYRDQGVCQWGTSKTDVTNYLGKTLYGYYVKSVTSSFGNIANSGNGNFCNSNGGLPTFTLVVTYEY